MMKARSLEIGIVGLGKIGSSLAFRAMEKGMAVSGIDKVGIPPALLDAGLTPLETMQQFREALSPPRIVFLYIPAGRIVEGVVASLCHALKPGDIVVDGGNSYWGDSIRRHGILKSHGIHFVDLGTSGGLLGARYGACFMAGGEEQSVKQIEPVLQLLSEPEGYVYAGPPGAGHFTKLVHNGIEFGMLQAIGEGMDLLERFSKKLPVADILRAWRHGSVIRSWLIDLMEDAYREKKGMEAVPGYIEDTGEVNWLVGDALQMEVPIPVIAASVMQLFASRDSKKYWARAVAMMRRGFGGHPYGPDKHIERFRKESRIEAYTKIPGRD